MGKTTLVREVLRGVRAIDTRRSAGRVLQRDVPFGVLDELLQGSVSDAFEADADDPVIWTLRGADLLTDEVTATTTTQPAVLVVDDLQWVDTASVVALDRTLPRLAIEPVTVLVALRPEARTRSEVAALLDSVAAFQPEHISVPALSREESEILVRHIAPERSSDEVAAIARHGAGNPLYLKHLACADEGQVSLGPVVAAHLRGLPQETSAMLRIAAVGGEVLEQDILQAVMGRDVTASLEIAEASGLVGRDGPAWRFEHDLIREAVAEACTPAERNGHLRTLATALSQRRGPHSSTEAAVHVVAAGPPFSHMELDIIDAAARACLSTDPGRSQELWGLLAEVVPKNDPRHEIARASVQEAQLWTRDRDPVDAKTAMRRLHRLYAKNALMPHDIGGAERVFRSDLKGQSLDDALATLVSLRPDGNIVEELTSREASLSELARIRLQIARSDLASLKGDLYGAAELARQAVTRAGSLPDTDETRINAMTVAGARLAALVTSQREGLDLLASATRSAEAAGRPDLQARAAYYSASAHHMWADWDQAHGLFSTVVSMEADVGGPLPSHARNALLGMAVDQGDRAAIGRLTPRPEDWDADVRFQMGADAALTGENGKAMRIFGALAADEGQSQTLRAGALAMYAASAMLTDDNGGRQFVRSVARTLAPEGILAFASRTVALALVELDLSSWPDGLEAEAPLIPAAAAAEGKGLVHWRLGQSDEAIQSFTKARKVWDKCGADARLSRVDSWLRDLGIPTNAPPNRGRPRFGWESLTRAELRVAALIAEGLKYRDIADQLFLSRRTVESQAANILRKLGLRNRGELAAAYLRRGDASASPEAVKT